MQLADLDRSHRMLYPESLNDRLFKLSQVRKLVTGTLMFCMPFIGPHHEGLTLFKMALVSRVCQ